MTVRELIDKLILLTEEEKEQQVFFWGLDDLPVIVNEVNSIDYHDELDLYLNEFKGIELKE